MRTAKRISTMPDLKIKAKKAKESLPENESIHHRFEVRSNSSFGVKGCNALLAMMYSQENDILFI